MNASQQIPSQSKENVDYLAAIWDQLKDQINPFLRVLCINGNIYRLMDNYGKRYIAKKFMWVKCREHTREAVMYCRDGNGHDRHYLGAPRHFVANGGVVHSCNGLEPFWTMDDGLNVRLGTAAVCQPTVPSKPVKIPRPPNAYILYRKDRHNIVKAANPGITNNEISQILGRAWNQESREMRQKYKEMSEEIKLALLEKHPDYQYKPRKSSEKRRRTRRSQQAHVILTEANFAGSSPDNAMAGDDGSGGII
ncbi:mat1-2-1 [Trichoderma arundinaceum]|uniref:Mat1-2-1 n=1 Tax=Trichoderma arundinaceum TaxID=490622 RepID=A0A395NLR4_TRIAR|nr:mat1-2-1 [Trichoderma arundinaceum]